MHSEPAAQFVSHLPPVQFTTHFAWGLHWVGQSPPVQFTVQ